MGTREGNSNRCRIQREKYVGADGEVAAWFTWESIRQASMYATSSSTLSLGTLTNKSMASC